MVYFIIVAILGLSAIGYYLYKSKDGSKEGEGAGSLEDSHKSPRDGDESKFQL